MLDLPSLWPHQVKAIRLTTDAIVDGHNRICLCVPTGGGKSRICWELCRDWLVAGFNVAVYTNRKMLIEQLCRTAREFGLGFGVRAADTLSAKEQPNSKPLQICSIQTEEARTLKKKVWQLHDAQRVIVDELHLNCAGTMSEIAMRHCNAGGVLVGLTATPLDLGDIVKHLIAPTTNSELRECGALVAARHYGCEEPDSSKIKKSTVEMTENDIRKIMLVQHLVGHVLRRFKELNPLMRPTLGFAPGVKESLWFAEQFCAAGIESAHIDGTNCWYKGVTYDSDADVRKEIMRAWRDGEVKVVWNRFVLREGIDVPFVEHMILGTIFGSLQSYLQSTGRGLRSSSPTGKKVLTIQDHGGNWWRHGSVNINRPWELCDTELIVSVTREERLRNKAKTGDREPMACPKCRKVLLSNKCSCGFQFSQGTRPVIMVDGKIKEHTGEIFRPKYTRRQHDTEKKWTSTYYRAKNAKRPMSFRQAIGLFVYEQGYWPPTDLPFMPRREKDFFRKVSEVPRNELT